MEENLKTLKTITLEKQILHAILDNPNLLFDEEYFISDTAIEMHYILLSLRDANKSFIDEHIIGLIVQDVSRESIKSIRETDYELEHFESYKGELIAKSIIKNFNSNIIKTLNNGDTDLDTLLNIEKDFNEAKNKIESSNKKYLQFSDLLSRHKKVIEKRSKGLKASTGCYLFDKLIPSPTAGIITLCGFSGSTKSTAVHYLLKNRIVKRMYTTFINTELSLEGLTDSITSSMVEMPYSDVMGINNEDGHIDYEHIINQYDFLSKYYKKNKNFAMLESNAVTLKEIEDFNIYMRKQFNMREDDLLFCFIDLLSMVSEFSKEGKTTRADTITQAINKLNEIALTHNILFFGTVQLKRLQQRTQIDKMEDLNKFIPTLSDIKDSGSYEERSRMVLSIHNPKHCCLKNPCNEVIKNLVEPIIEIQSLKDTYTGKTGNKIEFYFNSEYKTYTPYERPIDNSINSTSQNLENSVPYNN